MPKTIISDTSCFIVLTNIGELDLLQKLYQQITTTPEIAAEYGFTLPGWVEISIVKDKYKQQLLELQIDKGESVLLPWQWKHQTAPLFWTTSKLAKLPNNLV